MAVAFRDPDGYPLVFFVSAREGADYTARFPCTPFVYGTDIKAAYPSAEERALKKAADDAWIATCPTIAKYRSSEATRPLLNRWLATHAYGKDSLEQHKAYYATVPRCTKLAEVDDDDAKVVQTACRCCAAIPAEA